MKKLFKNILALMVVAAMMFGAVSVLSAPPLSYTNMRFYLMEDFEESSYTEFSMISEDGELIIHINAETPIYFEDDVPVRETLEEDQTLAAVLDGRNMEVTYAITTRSIPPQTSPITIKVLYEEIMSLTTNMFFADVESDDWFYASVVWAYENEIMLGVNEYFFAPTAELTRAMLVTILWNYAGTPYAQSEVTFEDAETDTWYSAALAWAAENSIVAGHGNNLFGPYESVTREQMVTILYNYMRFANLTIEQEYEGNIQLADEDQISPWARDAMHLMFNAGIVYKESSLDNYARPTQWATRAETAAAMYFFDMRAIPAD